MRPKELTTKIFLDGGDAQETKEILQLLGFLDGQTTNPTLVSRNWEVKAKCESGNCTKEDVYDEYKRIVTEISQLVPDGSVSIEVYADADTDVDTMFSQSQEMYSWIPNAHIKFPCTAAGLAAAERAVAAGMRVNMTLVFSQSQGAAVYAATRGAIRGQIFVSPFIGRLDDMGQNGMDLINNMLFMYEQGDQHVEVLTASVRSMDHFMAALASGSDSITAPYKILKAWGDAGMPLPDESFRYEPDLAQILFKDFDLNASWDSFDISHELTSKGIKQFSEDWNNLVKQ